MWQVHRWWKTEPTMMMGLKYLFEEVDISIISGGVVRGEAEDLAFDTI